MRIVQMLETLASGDGMGNHAILTHHLLKQAGFHVETYADHIHNVPEGIAKQYTPEMEIQSDDIILLHFGIGGRVTQNIKRFACRKIMVYQNITPPHFFIGYNRDAFRHATEAYSLVQAWAKTNVFDAIIAPSHYSLDELHKMGFPKEKTFYLPGCLMPMQNYMEEPDPDMLEDYGDGRTNILFVGRISPNKKQQDIVKAFAYYQEHIDPNARLILSGGGADSAYGKAVKNYIEALGLKNVIFPGIISSAALIALYQCADVFLCMSEHEGFCIPLVEAMLFDVPIIAFDAAAVPDTLGGAGVLLHEKDPVLTAKWIERVVGDKALRERIIGEQRRRLKDFDQTLVGQTMIDLVTNFISENIRKYQIVDAGGIHEKEIGARIDGSLYDIVNEKLREIGERMPMSREEYMRSARKTIYTRIH